MYPILGKRILPSLPYSSGGLKKLLRAAVAFNEAKGKGKTKASAKTTEGARTASKRHKRP